MTDEFAAVGRDPELAIVLAFIAASMAGPLALFISGAAGIGKTVLWRSALSAAAGNNTVLSCHPAEAETKSAFAGLADLFRDVTGRFIERLPAPQRTAMESALLINDDPGPVNHRAIGAATLTALESLAEEKPVLIAIDDVQWLDQPSARALGFALRRIRSEPVTLLATRRLEPTVTMLMLDAALRDRTVEKIELGPLSVGALGRIIDDQVGHHFPRTTMHRVHQASGGNPLHAVELARALVDAGPLAPGEPLPLPESLQALQTERVSRLPRRTREALLLSSLLSPPSEEVLARAFGERWGPAVAQLAGSGIAAVEDGFVRFSHPLLASTVASSATAEERRAAHRRLADATTDGEQRARHLALAADGPDADVAAALEDAARGAMQRGAPDAAAELAELSRSLTLATGPYAVCRRLMIAGEARFAAGDLEMAIERLEDAVAAAAPGAERAEALFRLGRVRYFRDDVPGSVRLLEEAVTEPNVSDDVLAAVEHALAIIGVLTADLEAALRHARAAVDIAGRTGSMTILPDAMAVLAAMKFFSGDELDTALLDRAIGSEDWNEPRTPLQHASVVASLVLLFADDFDRARTLLVNAERELSERGDEMSLPFVRMQLALIDWCEGDYEQGLDRAHDADRLATETQQNITRATTCFVLGLLTAHLGLVEEARTFAQTGVTVATVAGSAFGVAINMSVIGFVEVSLGRPGAAVAVLDPLVELARSGGFEDPAFLWFLPELIEVLIAEGNDDRAVSLTDWLEGAATAIHRPRELAAAARGRALFAASHGETDEALEHCEDALAHHERVTTPFDRARTLLVRGQIARRARKWGLARESLAAARDEFKRLGARLWLERAEAELARVGGRPSSALELSESERQAAELAASGKSNKDIAEAMFVSPKTVSATLSRVYRKLGVASRTELAARLRS